MWGRLLLNFFIISKPNLKYLRRQSLSNKEVKDTENIILQVPTETHRYTCTTIYLGWIYYNILISLHFIYQSAIQRSL